MKTSKQILVVLLLIAAVLAFTSCQEQSAQNAAPESEPTIPIENSAMPTSEPPTTTETTPEPAPASDAAPIQPFLTAENFPRMDGSTANLPLMAKVYAWTVGIDEETAGSFVHASRTPLAYRGMINDEFDILLAYEPSQGTKEEIAESGKSLDSIPIGRDALVFITNVKNPVDSLTTAQIRDIYEGKITNWREVGGDDVAIMAFQRDPDSGSQSLFMQLVMKDRLPMDAPSELIPSDMLGLIEALAAYENAPHAIGYSVYYYVSNMFVMPELKLIAVDGIQPSNETIANGSYPHVNDFYAVIRAGEPQDTSAQKLRDWLLTDEGKRCITEAGYVAIP